MKHTGLAAVALLVAMLSSGVAAATERSGTYNIVGIRIHTSKHSNASAQNNAVVLVNGGLGGYNGCTSGWYPVMNATSADSNAATHATLQAAFLAGHSVTIWYNDQQKSPWGDNTMCAVVAIQIN